MFGGYPYWINNKCNVDDVLRYMTLLQNVPFDDKCLEDVTSKISNQEQPKHNAVLWELHVSPKPLEQKNQVGCNSCILLSKTTEVLI